MGKKKILTDGAGARKSIRDGVNQLNSAVQATLGPCGRNVIVEREHQGPTITKDGVSVAKEIFLTDPIENIGAQAMKEVSMRAAKLAGDGTTTATVLATHMFNEGLKAIESGINPVELKRGMDKATADVIKSLKDSSTEISTEEEIKQVATISSNNDAVVGSLISEAMNEVGKSGVIQVEQSQTSENSLEIVEGMQIDSGYISPYYTTDNNTMTAKLDDPYILLCDKKISSVKEILGLLEACNKQSKPLLIIADDVDGEALATTVLNKAKGILSVCAIKAPGYGDRKIHMLEDIATLTGGTVITAQKGLKLDKMTVEHLGTARSVIISQSETVIVDGKGEPDSIKARVEEVTAQMDKAESDYEKQALKDRVAKLIGGVAVISIGAATELELKEKRDRVDDALHATRAAVEEGIVPGGGIALIRASQAECDTQQLENDDQRVGYNLVIGACKAPFNAILRNAGASPEAILSDIERVAGENKSASVGYDARKGEVCEMLERGILDPTKVARTAIELANSVAATLLTTECVISINPEQPKEAEQPHMGYNY